MEGRNEILPSVRICAPCGEEFWAEERKNWAEKKVHWYKNEKPGIQKEGSGLWVSAQAVDS